MENAIHLAVVWTLAAALPAAVAQPMGNPAGMTASTPGIADAKPADDHANNADHLFLQQAAKGGRLEVEMSNTGLDRTESSAVRDFANRMVEDHGKANRRIQQRARDLGTPLDDDPPDDDPFAEALGDRQGRAFDIVYMREQIGGHQQTVQLLEWQIGSGQNAETRQFAIDTLPLVLDHLRQAQAVLGELTGTGTEPRMPPPPASGSGPTTAPD